MCFMAQLLSRVTRVCRTSHIPSRPVASCPVRRRISSDMLLDRRGRVRSCGIIEQRRPMSIYGQVFCEGTFLIFTGCAQRGTGWCGEEGDFFTRSIPNSIGFRRESHLAQRFLIYFAPVMVILLPSLRTRKNRVRFRAISTFVSISFDMV